MEGEGEIDDSPEMDFVAMQFRRFSFCSVVALIKTFERCFPVAKTEVVLREIMGVDYGSRLWRGS